MRCNEHPAWHAGMGERGFGRQLVSLASSCSTQLARVGLRSHKDVVFFLSEMPCNEHSAWHAGRGGRGWVRLPVSLERGNAIQLGRKGPRKNKEGDFLFSAHFLALKELSARQGVGGAGGGGEGFLVVISMVLLIEKNGVYHVDYVLRSMSYSQERLHVFLSSSDRNKNTCLFKLGARKYSTKMV